MKTWIVIVAILLALGLFYLLYISAANEIEGFLTVDLDAIATQRVLLQAEGERRYNDFARVQSPRSQLPADQVDAAIRQTVPAANSSATSLLSLLGFTEYGAADDGTGKQGTGVEQTGMVQQKINFCESITTIDCNTFSDPRFAECGFCHKDGLDSKGKAHRGGMFISSDDQIRTNEAAGQGKANYKPTFGTCKPLNFTLMKDNCTARENNLACQRAGAALTSNDCGQCFGATAPGTTGLLYMGPSKLATPYTATLWVSHPGSHTALNTGAGTVIQIGGTQYTIPTSNNPDLDPQSLTVQVKEGDAITITVYGIPRFWCGWLTNGPAATRSIGLNLGETSMVPDNGLVIAGDSNSTVLQKAMTASPDSNDWARFKPMVPANTLWYQRRPLLQPAVVSAFYGNSADSSQGTDFTPNMKQFAGAGMDGPANPGSTGANFLYVKLDDGSTVTIASGSNIKAAKFANKLVMNVTIPASLVDPYYDDDRSNCATGPIIMTETGAGLMGSNSCFAADGSFSPSLNCMRMLFQSSGGTVKGTLYPQTEADAQALAKGTLDATVTYLNNLTNIAYYGVDTNGGPVSFDQQKDASMKMLGMSLNNPCDGPLAQTGPHSPECLDYLWRTSGNSSGDGQPVDMNTLPYSYCTAKGIVAPMNADRSVNQANVSLANSWGTIPSIRSNYTNIFTAARNTDAGFDAQAGAMRDCYNVNLSPPPEAAGECPVATPSDWQCFGPSKLQQPEVFYVSSGGYTTKQSDAESVCQTYGARVASTADLTAAQTMGADWCATGWVSDSTDAKYPISTSIQGGCGNGSTGVMTFTPGSKQAGVNCFGKKPTQGAALAKGVSAHNATNWNNPHSQTDPPQITFSPALNPALVLRHAGFAFWVQGGNAADPLYQKDSSFQIMPANNGRVGYVSFQATNFPGYYLRHSSFRCYLHQNTSGGPFNDDSSFKIVAPLNGNTAMCSIQASNFPNYYIAPKSATAPNDVWVTTVNMNDPVDKNRASWIRSASLLQSQNQPFKANAVPACKEANGQVVCASNDGRTPMLFGAEEDCNKWANPIDANGNPSASSTYTPAVAAPATIASVIDRYLRTRV